MSVFLFLCYNTLGDENMKIIDGKKISEKVLEEVKTDIEKFKLKKITPTLAIILVGNDTASKVYVKNKTIACQKVGVDCQEYFLDQNTSEEELINLIDKLNKDDLVHGILLQSPVPKHINIDNVFEKINPLKDVDGFNPINYGKLLIGKENLTSCTSLGIVRLLEEENIEIRGKNVVIIGRSNIVSKPLSLCMLNRDATITVCHSKTVDLKEHTKTADILISAVGKPAFVTSDMVKDGAVVIDVGINRLEDGTLCGDVDFDKVKDKCSYITKVPGGVGPMTVAYLMKNVVKAINLQL